MLTQIDSEVNPDEVDFELFCRLVAVYLELANNPKNGEIQNNDTAQSSYRQEEYGEEEQNQSENAY